MILKKNVNCVSVFLGLLTLIMWLWVNTLVSFCPKYGRRLSPPQIRMEMMEMNSGNVLKPPQRHGKINALQSKSWQVPTSEISEISSFPPRHPHTSGIRKKKHPKGEKKNSCQGVGCTLQVYQPLQKKMEMYTK